MSLKRCAEPFCGGQYLYEQTWDSLGLIEEGPECNFCGRKDPEWLKLHPVLNLEYDEDEDGAEVIKEEVVIDPNRFCRNRLHPWVVGQKQCIECRKLAARRSNMSSTDRLKQRVEQRIIQYKQDIEEKLMVVLQELMEGPDLVNRRTTFRGSKNAEEIYSLAKFDGNELILVTKRLTNVSRPWRNKKNARTESTD